MQEYIIIFTPEFANQNEITSFLEGKGMRCMSVIGFYNCLFIMSEIRNVDELSHLLHEKFPNGRHAVFSAKERQGWMPKTLWSFYNGQ